MAVLQGQTLAAKAYRVTIVKQQSSKNFSMSNEREETVMHILGEHLKLAQTKFKKCHDKVATVAHW